MYKYAASPDFEILLFGYSADGGPVRVVDFTAGEQLPAEVRSALTDPAVTKWAFNAQFERVCLSRWLGMPVGEYLEPDSWRCTIGVGRRPWAFPSRWRGWALCWGWKNKS